MLLPSGHSGGTLDDALDTACGLYFGDPTAWNDPSTNSAAGPGEAAFAFDRPRPGDPNHQR